METAIELDARSWQRFAAAEARRIMTTFQIAEQGGLKALEKALGLRLYSVINAQRVEWSEDGERLRFLMDVCRVQETRRRKRLADFPCKSVGTVEFETFARTIDSRIRTTCLHCPPEAPEGEYCGWEFSLAKVGEQPCHGLDTSTGQIESTSSIARSRNRRGVGDRVELWEWGKVPSAEESASAGTSRCGQHCRRRK